MESFWDSVENKLGCFVLQIWQPSLKATLDTLLTTFFSVKFHQNVAHVQAYFRQAFSSPVSHVHDNYFSFTENSLCFSKKKILPLMKSQVLYFFPPFEPSKQCFLSSVV